MLYLQLSAKVGYGYRASPIQSLKLLPQLKHVQQHLVLVPSDGALELYKYHLSCVWIRF